MSNMVLVSVFDHAVGEFVPCMCVNSEIAAAAIAPFVQKRLASLIRSRDACEAELKIVSGVPGFDSRVKYLNNRLKHINNEIFPLVNK